LSKEEFEKQLAALDKYTTEALKSREAALAVLVKAGIATSSGELAEQFRS